MVERGIFCIIDGQRLVRVTIDDNSRIMELKESISNLSKLPSKLTDEVVLWKLNQPLCFQPEETVMERLAGLRHTSTNIASKLSNSADKVSHWFPENSTTENVDLIEAILTILPGSDMSPSSSTESAKLGKHPLSASPPRNVKRQKLTNPWLHELHSKLWSRKEMTATLFRETEVTLSHFKELQSRLTIAPFLLGDVDAAIKIKLDVLANFKPPKNTSKLGDDEAAIPDDEAANGDLDDELAPFFPTTIQYLDLSSLDLQHSTFRRLRSAMLIREEYRHMDQVLQGEPSLGSAMSDLSAIVTGQPGIGKTTYVGLLIIEALIAGRPFVYQTCTGTVYLVSDEVVEIDETWYPDTPMVAYIDADLKFEFKQFLDHPNIQLIIACSPNGCEDSISKQISDMGTIRNLMFNLWTPKELFLTGIFLTRKHLTYDAMKEAVSYFGLNPRAVFSASTSHAVFVQRKAKILEKIRLVKDVATLYDLIHSATTTGGVSHSVFQISPKNDMRLLAEAQIGPVSSWALDQLLETYESRQEDAAFLLYQSLACDPSAGSIRGKIFERQLLKYFDKRETATAYNIRSLGDGSIIPWIFPGRLRRTTFQKTSFTTSLTDAVDHARPVHLVPLDPTFPAIDSVLHDPGEVLTGIQATVRNEHPVAVKGLQRIQSWIRGAALSSLRPSPAQPWRLLFVVPLIVEPAFQKQKLDGDTMTYVWRGKVEQYVLGLDEATLWS